MLEILNSGELLGGELDILPWFAKITAIILVGAVAAWLVQRRSPTAAHRIWMASLVGVSLMPLLALTLPTWQLPFGSRSVTADVTARETATETAAVETSRNAIASRTPGTSAPGDGAGELSNRRILPPIEDGLQGADFAPNASPHGTVPLVPLNAPSVDGASPHRAGEGNATTEPMLLMATWLTVTALLVIRLIVGICRLGKLVSSLNWSAVWPGLIRCFGWRQGRCPDCEKERVTSG